MDQRPAPQEYSDYRAYLGDMVRHLKASRASFSYRSFAKRAGFASVGYLKHLIDGDRKLAPASVDKVANGLGLSTQECQAFGLLVSLAHAESDEERTRLMRRLRASRLRRQLSDDEFELYSTWWAVPLRELLTMENVSAEPAILAKRFFPRITIAQVKRGLQLLERLGLLRFDQDGQMEVQRGTLETAPMLKSLAVRNYHRDMLLRAAESLELLPNTSRNVTSVTVKLDSNQYERVCKRIDEFQDELLSLLDEEALQEASEVYNVSFAVVPATRNQS